MWHVEFRGARRVRWGRVRVSGPSMVPTLHSDDLVLVRYRAAIRPGDVVVARFHLMPDRLVIKRAQRLEEDGWWLVSDNVFAGGDSEVHGVAEVLGRAAFYLPAATRGWRRWLPHRLHRDWPPGPATDQPRSSA
ncbi:peptidase S24-like protein [Jatrophihabitans sp. GAS493]|uniref:S24 family peptidase n=1 Tax=Jatrophihabitans sp. GAS493 TaxID=1907575 RepID=UPI000BB71E09|nr:S24 family peptidase [Jatrophihabitans sp. GAS493]SOD73258.1 peptidase S24-like protein [Jatrophihabitans sp. GAS493]